MTKHLLAFALFVLAVPVARAQGADQPTQALIASDSKSPVTLTSADVTLRVGNRNVALADIIPIPANRTQVALLIDKFSTTLPKTKLRGPDQVRPGTIILSAQ